MKKKNNTRDSKSDRFVTDQDETIRLAIQIGVVASCIVVISGDYSSLTPEFQLLTKILALLLGLLSMAYIMLTGRMFGFKDRKDSNIRHWFYDSSITFYWYIFFMMVYQFLSDLIIYIFGINSIQLYILVATISIITIAILCILKLKIKK